MADYVWDASLEIANVSDKVIQHIMLERSDRFSDKLDQRTMVRYILEGLRIGQQRACADCAYALPTYSRQHDDVSMLLPLYLGGEQAGLPDLVLLLAKNPTSYALVTVLTPQQAYSGVRLFRDPELTWLQGAMK